MSDAPERIVPSCVEALENYRQADMDGIMVLASRQAIHETIDAYLARVKTCEELEAKLAKAVEALTPSGDTKAEYAGEFHISVYDAEDEDGNEIWRKVPVDWTTIKAIMAAIKGRAAIAEINGGGDT